MDVADIPTDRTFRDAWRFSPTEGIELPLPNGSSLYGSAINDAVKIMNTTGSVWGLGGNDRLVAIGDYSNNMNGGSGNDRIEAGGGADTLTGGSGNDRLDGGTGADLVSFSGVSSNLTINLATGVATGEGTDTLVSIEDVIGGSKNDTIMGNSSSNEITAGSGDDYVNAGAGDDLIVGGDGAGNDRYIGGAGTDTVKYTSATAAITVDLVKGTATSTAGKDAAKIGTDTLSGIENVIAGNYNDIVKGSAGANVLTGGLGTDSVYGGSDKVKDVFDFNAITESKVGTARDKVYDFISKIDKIDLGGIDANSSSAKTNETFTFSTKQSKAYTGTEAKANSVWYKVADGKTLADVDGKTATKDIVLYGDVNGDAKADFEIGLVGVTSLTSADFVL